MLDRRISVAVAEQRIYELEAVGRTVVLVAIGGRLVGLLALQDGLRSGARAAVQHLLDSRVEPILMSSDTRETCEALGRALDIDHLRPEVLADERAASVERIQQTGATVAVIGHTPFDDEALGVADTPVVLAAAGAERDDFAVTLVSDDVRDAALAVAIAQGTRGQAANMLILVLVPVVFGILVVTVGVLPPEYAPLAQLVGSIAAAWHLRTYDKANLG
jgi:P-type E1-E2 ATPase